METVGGYFFTRRIAAGSTGEVFEVIQVATDRKFACKVVSRAKLHDRDFFHHFSNELLIHSKITHPSIIHLVDLVSDDRFIYIILEYCDEGDMNNIVMEEYGFNEEEARVYFRDIIKAVSFIHDMGIAHRDIKLENILVTKEGYPKLSDFGLSARQTPDNLLLTNCGTPVYAAPEVLLRRPYDGMKADIWSAGVCLYAMVQNHYPWSIDNELTSEQNLNQTMMQIINGRVNIPEDLSPELQDLLRNMLCIDPETRYTAAEVLSHSWMRMDMEEDEYPEDDIGVPPNAELQNLVEDLLSTLEREITPPPN